MAIEKIDTFQIEELDSNISSKLEKLWTDINAGEKPAAPPSESLIEEFCNFPFYKFEGKKALGDSIKKRIGGFDTKVLDDLQIELYTVESNIPTKLQGYNKTKVNWKDIPTAPAVPIDFIKSIYGGDNYAFGKILFENYINKGDMPTDVTATIKISKNDITILLEYKICGLFSAIKNSESDVTLSSKSGEKEKRSIETARNNIIHKYITGELKGDKTKSIIISTSAEAAQGILNAIRTGDVIDRSAGSEGETEKRGNFTITYY